MMQYQKSGVNTRREEIQHWSRYFFEQIVLPQFVLNFERQILNALNAEDIYRLEDIFDYIWRAWVTDVIASDMYDGGKISTIEELEFYMPYCCGDCGFRLSGLVQQLYVLCQLQQIIGVTMAKLADGTNVVILEMKQTDWLNLSTYIGIIYIDTSFELQLFTFEDDAESAGSVYIDGDSWLQVFTLEKDAESYFFYAIHVDSKENFGEIENNLDAFINAISILVTGQPTA